ncbi:hypothetical protein P43SY_003361 [Pythium insidiosum]|uniref:Uncharacterized protein n=1 Tax=Pythium insidiosum TaxID=114742 RepID=A0AAD5LFN0_PYTIN|nr:hypothetical protein P43SY_003361 [Pythium insidiosum]
MTSRFSTREFKGVAIRAVAAASAAVRKIRVDDEIIRKLRLRMVDTPATRDNLLEALTVIMIQLAERATSRKVRFEDVAQLIDGLPHATDAPDNDEAEWTGDASLAAEPTWQMERVFDRFRGPDRCWYALVAWEPTVEPIANIPRGMIAAFDRERRAIVRRTYIEDEAEEA